MCALQAHFSQLNDRDEAMSRSLNSDYLDQLLIKADTSGLDADLVRPAAEERPVPEEEQALLVFKRGYGPPCASRSLYLKFVQFTRSFQELAAMHGTDNRTVIEDGVQLHCSFTLDAGVNLIVTCGQLSC